MPKIFYIIILSIGMILSIILIIENMITTGTGFVLVWRADTYNLTIFSIICGIAIGYGLSGIINSGDQNDNSEDF